MAKVTNDLLIASDQGFVSVLVLLDLSAAFDTIDHQILLQRLEQLISIKGTALNWFKSYFSDRFQFVQINDESSCAPKLTTVFHRALCSAQFILIIYASTRKHYQDTLCKFPLLCG